MRRLPSSSQGGSWERACRFQECARILDQELGIESAEETRQVAAEIGRTSVASGAPGARAALATGARRPGAAAARAEPVPVLPPERKQLTVLCPRSHQALDSTDPEAALERIDLVLRAMMDAARGLGGTISHVHGDGITALFGAPVAQEDHAVRACYAALGDAVSALVPGPPDARVGIHSGEAVVRTLGDERAPHYDAVGPVPRLAAAIDAALKPGEIGSPKRHALTHRVAYESVLRERRRALHRRLIDILETRYPDRPG